MAEPKQGHLFTAVTLAALLALCAPAVAADAADSSWRDAAPKLYIQDETWADLNYLKSEITFVSYVRDRTEADVQLTITYEETGDGGREYCLAFLGLGDFADTRSVLKHTTGPDATPDDRREALADGVRRGLVPYVSRTRLRENLSIEFTPPTSAASVTDPWRNWVFTLSLDGWGDGDQGYSYISAYPIARIGRVTELAKLDLNGGGSVTRRWFVIDETTTVTALNRSWYAEVKYGLRLSDHVAVGAYGLYNTSSYNNIRFGGSIGPRLEYNFVPYPEYVRHKVYLQFNPTAQYGNYYDTTVYNRLSEYLFQNSLVLGAKVTRPWGTVSASAEGSHYLHDFARNRLSLYTSLSLRVVAGLSVSLSGGYNFIHDQVSLRKAGATEEERLLRLREMATGYSYWASVGLSYTFGSAFANIVNPIF